MTDGWADCATLALRAGTLEPAACASSPLRQRCVLSPTYPPHYALFRRLLRGVQKWAMDPAHVTVIGVLSSDPRIELEALCEKKGCAASKVALELTHTHQLITLNLLHGSGGARVSAARVRATELVGDSLTTCCPPASTACVPCYPCTRAPHSPAATARRVQGVTHSGARPTRPPRCALPRSLEGVSRHCQCPLAMLGELGDHWCRPSQPPPSSPTVSSAPRSRSCSARPTRAVSRRGSSTQRAFPSAPSASRRSLTISGRAPQSSTSRVPRSEPEP